MSSADTVYSVRWHGPEQLARGRGNVVTCPIERSGSAVTVSAATLTLKRGTQVLATITASGLAPPTATIPAETLAALDYGFGYQVAWSLTIDGTQDTYDRPAVVQRRRLFPVVTEADLTELHPQAGSPSLLPQGTTLQQWIDAAWKQIVGRLVASGTLPDVIVEPYALRDLHRYLALHLLFQSWGTTLQGGASNRWTELAERYGVKYEATWSQVSWLIDTDRDGAPDNGGRRRAARPQIFTIASDRALVAGSDW